MHLQVLPPSKIVGIFKKTQQLNQVSAHQNESQNWTFRKTRAKKLKISRLRIKLLEIVLQRLPGNVYK